MKNQDAENCEEGLVVVENQVTELERVRKPGRKKRLHKMFPKLHALKCWPEALRRLKGGLTPEEVARFIQDERFEYLDAKRNTLTRTLYRFRGELDPSELEPPETTWLDKKLEKTPRMESVLEELQKLYHLQVARISLDAATEFKINKLFRTTNSEIGLASSLLSKIAETRFKMGLDVDATAGASTTSTPGGVGEIAAQLGCGTLDDERMLRIGIAARAIIQGTLNAAQKAKEDIVEGELVSAVQSGDSGDNTGTPTEGR